MASGKSILGLAACCVAIAGFGYVVAAQAAGSGSMGDSSSMPSMSAQSPAQQARTAYNRGVRAVKRAAKYEADAAEATRDDKKTKAANKARKQYDTARKYFVTAATRQPTMHEAWNYVGFTSRKLGDTDIALRAYDEALRLKPTYNEAIEYRGVAYLLSNRLEDAKAAYMTLFRDDRKLADQLLQEMQQWLTAQRVATAGVPSAELDVFADWVGERATIAQQTVSMVLETPAGDWQ